jgi:amino acid adenylation domain-containing protein
MNPGRPSAPDLLSDEDKEILAYMRRQASTKPTDRFRVARSDRRQYYPLSSGQQRLWFLDQIEPGNPAYHFCFRLQFRGPFHKDALLAALNELARRHDVLRARFAVVDFELVQIIDPPRPVEVQFVDLSGATEQVRERESKALASRLNQDPFDLSAGSLVRSLLIRQAADDHVLLMCLHHIVTDRWSMQVFVGELDALYAAYAAGKSSPLEDLPIQYTDYAIWERETQKGEAYERSLEYWRSQLADLTTLALPTDRARPATRDFGSARMVRTLPTELTGKLRQLAKTERATLFMVYLTGFLVMLQRLTGQFDIVVGSPVSNRNLPELEALIGYFTNTLVLRVDLSGDPSVSTLLSRVRGVLLDAYRHQDVPFETLVEKLAPKRDVSRSPLFQVLFVHLGGTSPSPREVEESRDKPQLSQPKPVLTQPDKASTDYDLEVYISDEPGETAVAFHYRTDIFEQATIRRMFGHYAWSLLAMTSDPERRLDEISLLNAEQRMQVIEAGRGPRKPMPEQCVYRMIEAVARRMPGAMAVEAGDERLGYAALNERANRLARRLRMLGVGPGDLVGVCVDRSVELVVSVLGVMKSGGAYVPLDAEFPRERLAFMVEDSGLGVVVTRGGLAQKVLPETRAVLLDLDAERTSLELLDGGDLDGGASLDDLAYVIYTSGSTGRPKGVCIEHRALANFALATAEVLGLEARDRLLGVASLSFDASVLDLYVPLVRGAGIVLASRAVSADGALIAELIDRSEATLMHATPATWQMLRLSGWKGRAGIRALSGGEALPWPLAGWLAEVCESVVNLYGPTEATVYVAVGKVEGPIGDGVVGIGRPLANTSIHVLTGALQPVPPGVVGELCIAGTQVARGYLNREDLTKRQFVADPFDDVDGRRLYRTGDLARYRDDGSIEFLGRADHQVKIRGYRIELGEIESVLAEDAAVAQAVVLCREDVPGDQRLVGYVVARGKEALDVDGLRARLRTRLPAYMVPSAVVVLDAFPLTPNRKVDRSALPAPRAASGDVALAEAETDMERLLATVWRDALGVAQVGVHDNFFDLGGHSLLVVTVIERMRERCGIAVPPREYMMQNLRQIAGLYEHAQTVGGASGPARSARRPRRGRTSSVNAGGES